MKNKKKIKLIGGILVATMSIAALTGCGYEEPLEVPAENQAYVKLVEDNAVVFLESDGYYGVYDSNILGSRSEPYVRHRNMDNEIYITGVSSLVYVDKEDLETQLRAFVGEEGTITYYGDYDNEAINTFSKK